MHQRSTKARRLGGLAIAVTTVLAVGIGTGSVPTAGASSSGPGEASGPSQAEGDGGSDKGWYDARVGESAAAQQELSAASARAASKRPTADLRSSLGTEAVVDMDGLTGTVRYLARLDGFLTGRSSAPARKVAMSYVRANQAALGLRGADLSSFVLRRDYVDVAGLHHLSWVQKAGGLEVFGNGLQATVTEDGRLLTVGGSPISGLSAPALDGAVRSPSTAIAAAKRDVGESATVGSDDSAQQVLFLTPEGIRRGWETITMSAERPLLSVIDADSGRALFRQDLSSGAHDKPAIRTAVASSLGSAPTAVRPDPDDAAKKPGRTPKSAKGLAHEYFPNAAAGGRQKLVNFAKRGWLKKGAPILSGNNTLTWSDVVDDDRPTKAEQVRPRKKSGQWDYRLKPFHLNRYSFCDNPFPCSWNPEKPFSWKKNRAQNATQAFYFVNTWHDWLLKRPIGFNEAAGNFERVNKGRKGKDGDAVRTQTDDGANSDDGLPDGSHVDNANMATPPDGKAPTMQLYLQHAPGTSYPADGIACQEVEEPCDPWSPTNVGDEADTVYHEYTHGLSNRLVVDARGRSTLGPVQAGAMGEAWGDWYAMDYLEAEGLQEDQPGVADVVMFQYDGAGVYLDRYQPIDCDVDSTEDRCDPDDELTGSGGYTYADYGQIYTGPQVHSDGEIWTQTLWDLREQLGSRLARQLVTRGMETSANNPSFLDMRNAILLADTAIHGGDHHDAIWGVFANRGMGFFAGSMGGNDSTPAADFELPPDGADLGQISGTVTDTATGDPIQGAKVTLTFQGQPGAPRNPSARTDLDGEYVIEDVVYGDYPKLSFGGAGFEPVTEAVTVDQPEEDVDKALERNWAASSGGATVLVPKRDRDPNYGFGCNWNNLIDQNDAAGWASDSDLDEGNETAATPKQATITLPETVDIDRITIDPTANCGDGESASTGEYWLAVYDGTTWSDVEGTFTVDDLHQQNEVTLPADVDGISKVRFTMAQPIVLVDPSYGPDPCPDGPYSGCDYMDAMELRVFGSPTP